MIHLADAYASTNIFLLGLNFYICFDIHRSAGRRVAGRSLMPDRSNANLPFGLRSMDLKFGLRDV